MAQSKTSSQVFIHLGVPQAHGDTAEAVPFVRQSCPCRFKASLIVRIPNKAAIGEYLLFGPA
jgi:hypothetical protein